jgi:hypothetical protein
MYLSYLRVCAVWLWNRFIVGFFGVAWLSVVAATFTLIRSIKTTALEGYCTPIIEDGPLVLAPFITGFFNQTVIFLAITYGLCKNTLSRDEDQTFRNGILLMLGKSLPTFSKELLHDSQISYLIIMFISGVTLAWVYVWREIQVELNSTFRIALVPPFLALVTILICRVHRNTKLDLYSNAKSHTADTCGIVLPKFYSASRPIQIAVTHVDECRSDCPTTESQESVKTLDLGTV